MIYVVICILHATLANQAKSFLFKAKLAWKARSLHLSLFMNFVMERFLYAAINSEVRCNRWYETRFISNAFAVCMTWQSRACSFARNRAGSGGASGSERDEKIAADPEG